MNQPRLSQARLLTKYHSQMFELCGKLFFEELLHLGVLIHPFFHTAQNHVYVIPMLDHADCSDLNHTLDREMVRIDFLG
ncbi:hypothetical protein BDGGKGIB_02860 [Nodularia sphaerocarpa UHCC 0038]|nr:hypothetical protein BDGGKGIB_02860 [Nodularia sphaerocarpa UHCC 0038]